MSLTEERINEIKEIFSMVDGDGDGSITRSELAMCLRAMHYAIGNGEVNNLMSKFDSDKTGRIDFSQLLQIIGAYRPPSSASQTQLILAALKSFDTQNDETVSENDFRFLMQQTGEPLDKDSVDDMIKSTDARTKNGRIQYRKLVDALIHL